MAAKKKKAPEGPKPPEYPKVCETFSQPDFYGRIQREPSCFNGVIQIKRYRITIEEIEEPVKVLAARLVELWETTSNSHHRYPLQSAAAKLGITLPPGDFGKRCPPREY